MTNYSNKRVVIVGLGMTGLSCVDYFISKGVIPRIMDSRSAPPGIEQLPKEVSYWLGSLNRQWLLEADLIVVSPGISILTKELVEASQQGIELIGDIELFCREATAPIVAITGSNGKSTVTTLVGEMAEEAGWKVGVGGNIGLPVLKLLQQESRLYVLELSSFQLETTYSLKAAAATILNVTEDHMDRYPQGIKQYQQAKQRIYHQADCCLINQDDKLTWSESQPLSKICSFGQSQGDYHLSQQQQQTWLIANGQPVMKCEELKLVGVHNYLNALASLALADAVNIPRQACLSVLRRFSGLPHRCQLVWQNNGVKWINDSKATNVGSTEAALKGLDCDGTLYLLLGGDGKSADFSPLLPYVQGENIKLFCFGRDGDILAALRPEKSVRVETMAQAVKIIAKEAKAGDVILLSPACASLDQFKNYEQRGNEFIKLSREYG